jgi:NADH-quinone oxidoreductase E subunit
MEDVIDGILVKYPLNSKENLIPILQEIQKEQGYLSGDSLLFVSKHLNVPINQIFGVATFYDQFHFQKKGSFHIQVCEGTTCHVNQSSALLSEIEKTLKIKAGQTTRDGKFSIEVVSCLGACSQSPVMCINGNYYSQLSKDSLTKILTSF